MMVMTPTVRPRTARDLPLTGGVRHSRPRQPDPRRRPETSSSSTWQLIDPRGKLSTGTLTRPRHPGEGPRV